MKALVIIWVAALLSGVGTVGYISNGINQAIVKQQECVLQCPNVNVQPAANTVQITSTVPLQSDGGDTDIQPALGYKALNWQTQTLRVQ